MDYNERIKSMSITRRPGYYSIDFRPAKTFEDGRLDPVRIIEFEREFFENQNPHVGHRSGREFRIYFSRRPYYRYSSNPSLTTFSEEVVIINQIDQREIKIPVVYVSTNEDLAEINARLDLMEGQPSRVDLIKTAANGEINVSIWQSLRFPFQSKWDALYLAQPISHVYANITTLLQWCTDYAAALLWQPAYFFADKMKASSGMSKAVYAAGLILVGGPCWLIAQTFTVIGDALASARLALHAIVNLLPAVLTGDWERIKFCAREFLVNSFKLAPIILACTIGAAPLLGVIKGGLSALWLVAAPPLQRFYAGVVDSFSKWIRRTLWPKKISQELLADHGKFGLDQLLSGVSDSPSTSPRSQPVGPSQSPAPSPTHSYSRINGLTPGQHSHATEEPKQEDVRENNNMEGADFGVSQSAKLRILNMLGDSSRDVQYQLLSPTAPVLTPTRAVTPGSPR